MHVFRTTYMYSVCNFIHNIHMCRYKYIYLVFIENKHCQEKGVPVSVNRANIPCLYLCLPEWRYVPGDLYTMASGAFGAWFAASVSLLSSFWGPEFTTSSVMWFQAILCRFCSRKLGIIEHGSDVIQTQKRFPFCLSS